MRGLACGGRTLAMPALWPLPGKVPTHTVKRKKGYMVLNPLDISFPVSMVFFEPRLQLITRSRVVMMVKKVTKVRLLGNGSCY